MFVEPQPPVKPDAQPACCAVGWGRMDYVHALGGMYIACWIRVFGSTCEVLQFSFAEVKGKSFPSTPLSELFHAVLKCGAVFFQGGGSH